MKRLRPAGPDTRIPASKPEAVQAVLKAWRGMDWFWCGEEEMAALAVEACRECWQDNAGSDGDPGRIAASGPTSSCARSSDG